MVFEREDPVEQMFAVLSGEVHLLRRQLGGGYVILQRAGAGAILAEASLISDSYHCAAVAVRDSELAVFGRAPLRARMRVDASLAENFAAHLAGEVRSARMKVEILALKRVGERLDAWLTWHDQAMPEKGEWQRLAREIGVSPEALYRELARRRGNEPDRKKEG